MESNLFIAACVAVTFILCVLLLRSRAGNARLQQRIAETTVAQSATVSRLAKLEDLLALQKGIFFSFALWDNEFIHTSCYGRLPGRVQPSEIVGHPLSEFLSSDLAQTLEAHYKQAWTEQTLVRRELTSHTNRRYILLLDPIVVDGVVREVAGFVFDISDRNDTENALFNSDARYHRLVEMSPEGIAVLRNSRWVFVNRAAIQLLGGVDTSAFVNRHISDYIHPDDLASTVEWMTTLPGNTEMPDSRELRMVRLDGEVVDVEVVGVCAHFDAEPALQFVFRDITMRKHTEDMLRRAKTLAVVGEMAAGIAHEIRNPLTALRGFVQLLKHKVPNHEAYYQLMLSESDRINSIVSELLALAKPQQPLVEEADLRNVVQTAANLFQSQAMMRNVTLRFHFDADVPVVTCDENQLKQAIINILQNAVDAMPSGGVVNVSVRGNRAGAVQIDVRDEGCGIERDRIPKLGEPCYTTKEKGVGLGLMMTYQIVHRHGGHIMIDSEPGLGTTVTIELPGAEGAWQSPDFHP